MFSIILKGTGEAGEKSKKAAEVTNKATVVGANMIAPGALDAIEASIVVLNPNSSIKDLKRARKQAIDAAKAAGTVIIVHGVFKGFGKAKKVLSSKSPYQIAKEGGKHAGWLKQYQGKSPNELKRGISSFKKQITKHKGYIKNPASKVKGWEKLPHRQQRGYLKKWSKDIIRQQEQKEILEGILKDI